MAEYVFDESMKVVGADRKKMDIIQMDPEEGAAALVSGDVVMACLFGGNSIKAATAVGSRLLTVQEARDAGCLLYTSPSPRDVEESRMPSSA